LPVFLFILFATLYVAGCIYLYVRMYLSARSLHRSKFKASTMEKLSVITITVFSMYFLLKWTALQVLQGCTTLFIWNPHCYDLNYLNRGWIMILLVVGVNAIMLSFAHDIRMQARNLRR
jgi:hypothetical protein